MFQAVVLLIIGTVLIVLNYKAIKKEKSSFNTALMAETINMNDYDVELGKLKAEFAEDIAKLQSEIYELKELEKLQRRIEAALGIEETEAPIVEKEESEEIDKKPIKKTRKSSPKKSDGNKVRISEIKDMLNKNMSIDEIAQELNMGKGELLLIKDLYIK